MASGVMGLDTEGMIDSYRNMRYEIVNRIAMTSEMSSHLHRELLLVEEVIEALEASQDSLIFHAG